MFIFYNLLQWIESNIRIFYSVLGLPSLTPASYYTFPSFHFNTEVRKTGVHKLIHTLTHRTSIRRCCLYYTYFFYFFIHFHSRTLERSRLVDIIIEHCIYLTSLVNLSASIALEVVTLPWQMISPIPIISLVCSQGTWFMWKLAVYVIFEWLLLYWDKLHIILLLKLYNIIQFILVLCARHFFSTDSFSNLRSPR